MSVTIKDFDKLESDPKYTRFIEFADHSVRLFQAMSSSLQTWAYRGNLVCIPTLLIASYYALWRNDYHAGFNWAEASFTLMALVNILLNLSNKWYRQSIMVGNVTVNAIHAEENGVFEQTHGRSFKDFIAELPDIGI